jgi:hypothetical protein
MDGHAPLWIRDVAEVLAVSGILAANITNAVNNRTYGLRGASSTEAHARVVALIDALPHR